jgi:hypothetical protein
MTLKNMATLYQRSNNTEKHSDVGVISTLIQRRDVVQCSLKVDAMSLCFSVLFER